MFKCLCCRGPGRAKSGGGGGGGGGSHKFSLESEPYGAVAAESESGRYRRKKLEDDDADRVDAAAGQHRGTAGAGAGRSRPPTQPQKPPNAYASTGVSTGGGGPRRLKEVELEDEQVLRVEQRQQKQPPQQPPQQPHQQKHQHQPTAAAAAPGGWVKVREPHEHQHGSTVFQSDENETTIVDSDYSDYEDEDEKPPVNFPSTSAGSRTTATLSVIQPRAHLQKAANTADSAEQRDQKAAAERLSTFLLAAEEDGAEELGGDLAWQTLPNGLKPAGGRHLETLVEEEPIIVVQPPPGNPAPHLSQQQQQQQQDENSLLPAAAAAAAIDDDPSARESLFALDRALAVFELASMDPGELPAAGFDAAGEDNEERILPLNAQARS